MVNKDKTTKSSENTDCNNPYIKKERRLNKSLKASGEKENIYEKIDGSHKHSADSHNKKQLNSNNHSLDEYNECSLNAIRKKRIFSKYKQEDVYYEINTDAINNGTEKRTTCMLKNIPCKYNYDDILKILNENHRHKYDFVYLMLNFDDGQNAGYAFINFVNIDSLLSFYTQIHNTKWKINTNNKLAEICFAHIQGIEELIQKLKRSNVLMQNKRFWPRFYCTDGEKAGEQMNVFNKQ